MNQGKLEAVKQEMAKVNISILGVRELKWPGMGEFNSDDFYANVFQLLFCSSFTVSHGQQLILMFFLTEIFLSLCTQVLHFGLFCQLWGLLHFF